MGSPKQEVVEYVTYRTEASIPSAANAARGGMKFGTNVAAIDTGRVQRLINNNGTPAFVDANGNSASDSVVYGPWQIISATITSTPTNLLLGGIANLPSLEAPLDGDVTSLTIAISPAVPAENAVTATVLVNGSPTSAVIALGPGATTGSVLIGSGVVPVLHEQLLGVRLASIGSIDEVNCSVSIGLTIAS